MLGAMSQAGWVPTHDELAEMVEVLFELSQDMMCVAAADGRFIKVNAMWSACLGYSHAELTSGPWLDFVHPDDKAKTVAAAQQMGVERLIAFENRYRHKDGSYRRISWRASPWSGGRAFAIARDLGPAAP